MKNRYFIFLVAAIAIFSLLNLRYKFVAKLMDGALNGNSKGSIDMPKAVSIGHINEGKLLTDSFVFHNNTRDAIYVKDIQSSCSCTVLETVKNEIPARDSGLIKFKFNSYGKSGSISEPISVYLGSKDSSKQYIVYIEGYVDPVVN